MVASADVANRDEMQRVVKMARERFGARFMEWCTRLESRLENHRTEDA